MITPIKKRITTSATTTAFASSCLLVRIVIACQNAGTDWTLRVQDKASSPFVLLPTVTLIVPSDGYPNVFLKCDEFPLPMEGGIDIVTTGATPGEIAVWLIITTNP